MVVNTSKIVGYVVIPNDTVREKSSIIFRMTGFDTDDDDSATVVPFPIDAPIADDGSIDVDLWPNPEGVRATFYQVTASLYNGIRPVLVDLGKISVPVAGGPFDLNDLLPVAPPQGADVDDYIAYLAAAVASAEAASTAADASAANAADSAAQAALFDGPRFGTIAAMASSDIPTDGDYINVDRAFNNESELFRYDAASTLPADGTLIVTPASGVGRYVSTRTVYADYSERLGDHRGFDAGTTLTVLGIDATYVATDGIGVVGLENQGGQAFDLLNPSGDVLAFGVNNSGEITSIDLQRAVDYGYEKFKEAYEPYTLHYPRGTYVFRNVNMRPGVNHFAEKDAVFLKTPTEGGSEESQRFWRMFTTVASHWNVEAECDHRIVFDGLIFDGNMENLNWTNNTYNQEQGHCLFLDGPSAGVKAEHRLKALVRGVTCINSVGDGLSIYRNADVIVETLEADNCFRGGFVATGGNSIVKLRGYRGENARLDIEVDGAGFDGSFSTDYDIEDVSIDRNGGGIRPGGIDFGGSRGGSFYLGNAKVFTEPFNYSGQQDDLEKLIENSMFTLGGRDSNSNRFAFASNAVFRNVDFVVKFEVGSINYSAIHMYPGTVENAVMEFDRCRFILDDGVKTSEPTAVCNTVVFEASLTTGNDDNGNTKYVFRDCESIGGWDVEFNILQGGTLDVVGGDFSAESIFRVVSTSGKPAQLTTGGKINLKDTVSSLFTPVAQATQLGAYIDFSDTILSRYVASGYPLTTYPVFGNYEFPITERPASFGAIRGSIAKLDLGALGTSGDQISVRSWVAETSNASNSTFRPSGWTTAKGDTASRPTLHADDYGVQYLDTTLDADGKPIWWSGSVWVDSLGAAV